MSKRRKNEPELSLNPCKLKGEDRGGRSSRLGMFATLFTIVWAPIYSLFLFLGMLGFAIGAGTIFLGVLGGVGLVVLVGWFVVNLFSDATSWSDPQYRLWRKSGGDPYFDWTWFWPLNNDSDQRRRGQFNICPNPKCGGHFSVNADICPHCNLRHMDFVWCPNCQHGVYDPDGFYYQQCGIHCPDCGAGYRDPAIGDAPVIPAPSVPRLPMHSSFVARLSDQQNPRIFES